LKTISDDSFSDNLFVNESLKLLEKYKISDIVKENKKLVTLFNNFDTGIKETYDTRLSNLHKALSTFLTKNHRQVLV
jgi:phage host-nuclease inhibitor protein Gam